MGETRIGQGREAARAHLVENPDVADEIEYKVREKLGLIPTKETPPAEPAD